MGIQKMDFNNQYQDSLCRIFMFLVQERLKIKILKVITHQGGCGHELYACKYINYILASTVCKLHILYILLF